MPLPVHLIWFFMPSLWTYHDEPSHANLCACAVAYDFPMIQQVHMDGGSMVCTTYHC
jgi:hypothetical protein